MEEYNKASKEVYDPIKENRRRLVETLGHQIAELFPMVIKDGEIDVNSLLSELGQYSVNEGERYELKWAGKEDSKRMANLDILGKTLRFVLNDSKDPEKTENIYIEGENLEVLKLLRGSYYNRIKLIYIDPPYNTGKDFVYKDKFTQDKLTSDQLEGELDDEGVRLILNQKSCGRFHSNWLNMIYPRIKIARDLLTDDGLIFISIDNNEIDNLLKVCNEIFGESNFVSCIANINNPKGRSDDKYFATAHEYIVVYKKNNAEIYGFEPDDKVLKRYNKQTEDGRVYREIDLRKTGDGDRREDRPNMFYYFLYNERSNDFFPTVEDYVPEGYIQIFPTREDGSYGRWRWGIETAKENISNLIPKFMKVKEKWTVMEADYLTEDKLVKPTTNWNFKDVNSERGTEDFINLGFKKEVFERPKPVGTIERILKITTRDEDIILDFFSGSATSAHAVMKINADDSGKRKFILVQTDQDKCDEKSDAYREGFKNICEIGKERIRRAGEKIKEEFKDKPGIENLDVGFKVFKVADTNIRWFSEAIKSDVFDYDMTMTDKDKLDFNPGFTDIDVVYEILLRHRDIPLSTNVEQLSNIGDRTYIFADTVVVCLEETIADWMIDKIAAIEPMPTKIIFRDSAFGDDISLKENTMIRLEAQMRKHSGLEKRAYRVEFI